MKSIIKPEVPKKFLNGINMGQIRTSDGVLNSYLSVLEEQVDELIDCVNYLMEKIK